MNRSILLLAVILLVSACETGTKYDKNETIKQISNEESRGSSNKNIEALLEDEELVDEVFVNTTPHQSYIEEDSREESVSNVVMHNGFNVKKIRVGENDSYTRLVFDIENVRTPSGSVGTYKAKYYASREDIVVQLEGYSDFSANLPRFSHSSLVEKIYLERQTEENSYRVHIKLRQEAKVRIFDLKNTARLVFDIKAI